MSDHSHNLMPRKMLIAIASLIGFSLVLVITARLTGLGISHVPLAPVVQSLDLRFEGQGDAALTVRAVADGTVIKVLEAGSNQFIRGVLRSTARARRSRGVDDDTPFQVARLADGRLILRDLGTGQVIELRSFGPTNEGAFAALLDARVTDPAQAPPVTATQTRQPL